MVDRSPSTAVLWALLPARLVLFALGQAVITTALAKPWDEAVPWWPVGIVVVNLLTIAFLIWLLGREEASYRAMITPGFARLQGEALSVLGLLALFVAIAMVPYFILTGLFFETEQQAVEMMYGKLPLPVSLALLLLFPVTIALAELPLYFGYLRPRIEKVSGSAMVAVGATAFFAAIQHMTMPLVFDWTFALWRGSMFVPFALFLAITLRTRPHLLGVFMIAHAFLDLSVVAMTF